MQPRSSACSLIAIIQFVLHSQASRAIKKVVCCNPGLPFKGWNLEPSDVTQVSGGGALFPGRGTPAISWQIPKGGGQRLLWVHRKGGGGGQTRGPDCAKDTCTHTHTHFLTGRHALARTHIHPHLEHSPADMSGGNMCKARTHLHAHTTASCTCHQQLHTLMGLHGHLHQVCIFWVHLLT